MTIVAIAVITAVALVLCVGIVLTTASPADAAAENAAGRSEGAAERLLP
jgi:hypothetical protein